MEKISTAIRKKKSKLIHEKHWSSILYIGAFGWRGIQGITLSLPIIIYKNNCNFMERIPEQIEPDRTLCAFK